MKKESNFIWSGKMEYHWFESAHIESNVKLFEQFLTKYVLNVCKAVNKITSANVIELFVSFSPFRFPKLTANYANFTGLSICLLAHWRRLRYQNIGLQQFCTYRWVSTCLAIRTHSGRAAFNFNTCMFAHSLILLILSE